LSKRKLEHPSLDIVESKGTELSVKKLYYVLLEVLQHTNQLNLQDY